MGRLLINGNLSSPSLLAQRAAPWLRTARPDGRPPQVLLITAAWGPGEYGENPVREALNAVGVPSLWHDGFDRNISNLCAWHVWQAYLQRHPRVAQVDAEVRTVREATRRFYVEKTRFHAQRIREAVHFARQHLGAFRLGDLPLHERDPLRPLAVLSGRELLGRAVTRELVHSLEDLVQHDARMLAALEEAEQMLPERTGLRLDPDWQRQQAMLAERILRADVLLLPGGDPEALLGALRFFDLGPALRETLRRGATFVSVSAGSLVLGERIVLYDDFSSDPSRREFRLFDRGLGLVGGLQILPHCMDRIHTHDGDNLAYLARRFSSHLCVGLNEESFLLVEPHTPAATSVGSHDGVYVFGADGIKLCYRAGEHIALGAHSSNFA